MTRTSIPPSVARAVLVSSARRCAFCFGLDGDLERKRGQIAHIDRDHSNAAESNLAFLCLLHHDEYDGRSSQSKNLTPAELLEYRGRLSAALSRGEHIATRKPGHRSSAQAETAGAPLAASGASVLRDWPAIFESGIAVVVEIASLPDHLSRSMVIPGQRYHVRYSIRSSSWHSEGPIQHPTAGLVRRHTNEASTQLTGLLGTSESHTQLSECPGPRSYRLWLMDIELVFDVNGTVFNDYPPHGRARVGRLLLAA